MAAAVSSESSVVVVNKESHSATRIQARQRGKQDRRQLAEQRGAAVKMQSVQRGRATRRTTATSTGGGATGNEEDERRASVVIARTDATLKELD